MGAVNESRKDRLSYFFISQEWQLWFPIETGKSKAKNKNKLPHRFHQH